MKKNTPNLYKKIYLNKWIKASKETI
jgi:hypothetical protein